MVGPSLLDYGRFHGLAANHLSPNLFTFLDKCRPQLTSSLTNLPDFAPPDLGRVLDEAKFQLTRHERDLLAHSVARPGPVNWKQILPDHHRIHELKLELPLLVHGRGRERDMAEFGFGETVNLQSHLDEIVDMMVNEDDDGELSRSSEITEMADDLDREISNAKMSTTREVVLSLQRIVKDTYTKELGAELMRDLLKYERKPQPEPISPILMPMEMSPEPFVPWSPMLDVTLRSDPADLDSPFSREVLREMQDKDMIDSDSLTPKSQEKVKELLWLAEHGPDIDAMKEIAETFFEPKVSTKEEIAEDLKLEVPMSPPETVEKAKLQGRRNIFSEILEEIYDKNLEDDLDDQETERELLKLAEVATAEVKRQLDTEKIEPPDLTCKLDTPKVEAVSVQAPWKVRNPTETGQFVSKLVREEGRIVFVLVDPKDDLKLNWIPFPAKLASLGLEETFEDRIGYLKKVSAGPKNITKSAQMLWRPEKLKLFDDKDDSEDEMEEDRSLLDTLHIDTQPLLQKRIVPLKRPHLATRDVTNPNRLMPPPPPRPLLLQRHWNGFSQSALGGVFNPAFSAAGSLDSFMGTRGKKPKLRSDHFPAEVVFDDIESTQLEEEGQPPISIGRYDESQVLVPATPVLSTTSPAQTERISSTTPYPPLPLPATNPLSSSRTIILNYNLLRTHRSLVSFIESRASTTESRNNHTSDTETENKHLTIIYRNLGHSASNSAHLPTPVHAPDLILNPTTCLILTTLQALTQRPLPGQSVASSSGTSGSPVHHRILDLAPKYDLVIVLLTHAMSIQYPANVKSIVGAVTMSEIDSMTWTAFSAFCASLDSIAAVKLILVPIVNTPGNSKYDIFPPGTLANPQSEPDPIQTWLWAIIEQHAFRITQILPQLRDGTTTLALQQEDDLWSMFLQRCGLNPFASLVVLSALRENVEHGISSADSGLRRFIQMSREERLGVFGELNMLGHRAVETVGAVLDRVWRL